MKGRVLVVDDDTALSEMLGIVLSNEGFEPVFCANGDDALAVFRDKRPDLVLLDLMLPELSGMEVARILRRESDVPILMLTARGSEIDKVVGLELGADDYIAKPFSPRELVARVRTVLRRVQRSVPNAVAATSVAGFDIDDERKTIRLHGRALDLSRTEYRLLKVLIERPGRVFSRDELMERAWDDPASAFDRTVDAHVKALRAKLRDAAPDDDPIVTHRGLGYSLREDRNV